MEGREVPGETCSIESQGAPCLEDAGATEVLAKIEVLATTQTRMEALLMDIRKDLGALSLHVDSLGQPLRSTFGEFHGQDVYSMPVDQSDQPSSPPAEQKALEEVPGSELDSLKAYGSEHLADALEQALAKAQRELGDSRKGSYTSEVLEVPQSLPHDWPASLQSRAAIPTGCGPPRRSGGSRKNDPAVSASVHLLYNSGFEDNMVKSKGWSRRLVVDPSSGFYTVYNIIFMLVLVHDVLHIPFTLAWDLQMVGLPAISAWISCGFWTADVVVTCITGYSRAGKLEMRLAVVVWRYAKTWLVPDLVLNICDWFGLIMSTVDVDEDSIGGLRAIRFLKFGKLLRLIGLIRMMRAVRMIEEMVENRFSGAARLLLQCVAFSCSLLMINHMIGCAWYAIGRMAPSDTGMRWIDLTTTWNGEVMNLSQHGLQHQYISAVHWSMAQIVGGNMDIIAYNSCERVYNMLCMASGLIFGCSIVSMLSTSLVEYQVSKNDQIQKIRQLRRYLVENNISQGVATLAQQQASARLSMQTKLKDEDVHALQLLSTSLRSTIRYERFHEQLSGHALFRLWISLDVGVVRELCVEAMDSTFFRPHDFIFEPGVKCSKAYVPMEGQVSYVQEPSTAPVQMTTTTTVKVGQWICEAALWSHWIHVGRAAANTHTQMLTISSHAMMNVLEKHGPVTEVTAEYCRHFHRRIVTARPPNAPWPTDLEIPFTELSDLVVSMDTSVQQIIGLSALELNHGFAALQEEVLKGKSCVVMNAKGEIERVVSVVVLHMTSCGGEVLAELGKIEGKASAAGSCQLPGLKQEAGEMMNATLTRLLDRFHVQPADVELTMVDREVTWKNSKEFGVHTQYIRTVHHMKLLQDIPIPSVALRQPSRAEPETELAGMLSERRSEEALQMPREPSLPHASRETSLASCSFHVGPVYNIQSGSKNVLYSWLHPDRFQYLKSPAGEQELNRWLGSLKETALEDLACFCV